MDRNFVRRRPYGPHQIIISHLKNQLGSVVKAFHQFLVSALTLVNFKVTKFAVSYSTAASPSSISLCRTLLSAQTVALLDLIPSAKRGRPAS